MDEAIKFGVDQIIECSTIDCDSNNSVGMLPNPEEIGYIRLSSEECDADHAGDTFSELPNGIAYSIADTTTTIFDNKMLQLGSSRDCVSSHQSAGKRLSLAVEEALDPLSDLSSMSIDNSNLFTEGFNDKTVWSHKSGILSDITNRHVQQHVDLLSTNINVLRTSAPWTCNASSTSDSDWKAQFKSFPQSHSSNCGEEKPSIENSSQEEIVRKTMKRVCPSIPSWCHSKGSNSTKCIATSPTSAYYDRASSVLQKESGDGTTQYKFTNKTTCSCNTGAFHCYRTGNMTAPDSGNTLPYRQNSDVPLRSVVNGGEEPTDVSSSLLPSNHRKSETRSTRRRRPEWFSQPYLFSYTSMVSGIEYSMAEQNQDDIRELEISQLDDLHSYKIDAIPGMEGDIPDQNEEPDSWSAPRPFDIISSAGERSVGVRKPGDVSTMMTLNKSAKREGCEYLPVMVPYRPHMLQRQNLSSATLEEAKKTAEARKAYSQRKQLVRASPQYIPPLSRKAQVISTPQVQVITYPDDRHQVARGTELWQKHETPKPIPVSGVPSQSNRLLGDTLSVSQRMSRRSRLYRSPWLSKKLLTPSTSIISLRTDRGAESWRRRSEIELAKQRSGTLTLLETAEIITPVETEETVEDVTLTLSLRWSFFCILLMTVLSNYDHGAIPACLNDIASDFELNYTEQSLLGSLVYFGLIIGTLGAGALFQLTSAKWLLLISLSLLFVSISTLSLIPNLPTIYISRFVAGMSQAFPAVYLPVWVDEFSPPGSTVSWMAYTQLSSIAGTVVGYFTAGILTRLPQHKKGPLLYLKTTWTATFWPQALALLPTIIFVAFADKSKLDVNQEADSNTEEEDHVTPIYIVPSGSGSQILGRGLSARLSQNRKMSLIKPKEVNPPLATLWDSLYSFLSQPVYVLTTLGMSNLYFIATGVQFWVTQFMVDGLGYDKLRVISVTTFCFLTSPTLGVYAGGIAADYCGGSGNTKSQYSSSVLLMSCFAGISFVLASIAGFTISFIPFVVLIWSSLFCGAAIVPIAVGLLMSCVTPSLRPLSSATSQISYNLLGWFAAPLISGAIMDGISAIGWKYPLPLIYGFRSVLLSSFFGFLCFFIANFTFENLPVPEPEHVSTIYRYFAYVPDDPPPLTVNGVPIGLSPSQVLSMPLLMSNLENGESSTNSSSSRLLKSKFVLSQSDSRQFFQAIIPAFRDESTRSLSSDNFQHSLSVKSEERQLQTEPSKPKDRVTEIIFDNIRFVGNLEIIPDSVQVSVMSYDDFWNRFLPVALDGNRKTCCTDATQGCKLNQLVIPEDVTTFRSVVVDVSPTKIDRYVFKLPSSDMYLLLFSNCGSQKDIAVSGSLYLRNYFGYLPGLEVPKVSFYLILASVYVLLLLIWGILALKHRAQLIHIHLAITVVLILGLIECLVWFLFYRVWNTTPKNSPFFLGSAIVITVVKNILAFMLVLVASLGWGITKPYLSVPTKQKICLIIFAYVFFDSARQIMTQVRLSQNLPFLLVLCCILPVSLLHGIIFFWIFSSLGGLIEEMSVKKQEQKLKLFSRFWIVLMNTMIAAIIFLCTQVFLMSRESPQKWRQEWLFSDVFPHLFFLCVLIAMTVLWAPSRSLKAMAYSSELPGEESSEGARNLNLNVFGRENVYRDNGNLGKENLIDDEYNRIEMKAADAEKQNPKVWGKKHTTIEDLDYDDDDA